MLLTKILGLAALATSPVLAAVVDMYRDGACQDFAGTRNVWDETGAGELAGFSSMRVTKITSSVGLLTVYKGTSCGCPTCGSKGWEIESTPSGCLQFNKDGNGFVGHALGWAP